MVCGGGSSASIFVAGRSNGSPSSRGRMEAVVAVAVVVISEVVVVGVAVVVVEVLVA